MFHSYTPQYNKDVILKGLTVRDGVVRVVYATIALGMGIDLKDVCLVIIMSLQFNSLANVGRPKYFINYNAVNSVTTINYRSSSSRKMKYQEVHVW